MHCQDGGGDLACPKHALFTSVIEHEMGPGRHLRAVCPCLPNPESCAWLTFLLSTIVKDLWCSA